MDSNGRLTIRGNQQGLALVYIALMLISLCAFIGLAVDIGYMYVAKGQLQNAADSAALAGASQLPSQTDARTKAKEFAAANSATNTPVNISSSGANTLTPDNDITVGNWTRTLNPQYLAGREPINAVQVRARRTDSSDVGGRSADGPVGLFFARVIAPRWSQMGTSAVAIANRPPRAGFFLMVGRDTCNSTSFPVHLSPAAGNMAWTSLLNNSTSTSDTTDNFICPIDKVPDEEVCGHSIYTTNGTANAVFQAVEVDFYDPDYDRINKTYGADGSVSTWTVIVPVSTVNDPSIQPSPQPVWGYASIVLTRACGAGGGSACPGRPFTSSGACAGSDTFIEFNAITCVDCASSSEMSGVKPSLVQ